MASEVNISNVTTFAAGTPAVAAEVNATLSALITAINDNNQRIPDYEALNTSSIAGRTYKIQSMDTSYSKFDAGNVLAIVPYVSRYTVVFTDSTFTITGPYSQASVITSTSHAGATPSENETPINDTYIQTGQLVNATFEDLSEFSFTISPNGSS